MNRLPWIGVHLAGLAAFALPFFVASSTATSTASARSGDAPWFLALLAPLLIAVAISESSRNKLDARTVALLGVLGATAAMMRLPVSFAGANLMYYLPIVCGAVFGSGFGFLLGSLAMGCSALITGGIGPWLPFQMWAMGWVGLGAGMIRPIVLRSRPIVWLPAIAAYGAVAAFFFGMLMNLYFWPVVTAGASDVSWRPGLGLAASLNNYRNFYILTSLGWDAIGAMANAVVLGLLARPTIEILSRYQRRFSFDHQTDIPAQATARLELTPALGRDATG